MLADILKAFLEYCYQLESPVCYLRWAGLATIAGVAQRKIYAETTAYMAYPNLYVVLTGPAGSKKSTAIHMGRRLLEKVPNINLSSDAPSVAGLMLEFKDIADVHKEHQSLNAFIYELSTLYENAPETMTGFLTAIYDGKDNYSKRTRLGGREEIPRPWLNMIAATTPTWLGNNLNQSAVEGGLVARTLYVYSDEQIIKSPFPRYTPELKRLEEALVHDLAHISVLNGVFDFEGGEGGDAYTWYDRWYKDDSRLPRIRDNRTYTYFVRKPQHLLKVAMLVSLSKRDTLKFTVEDLEIGLALLDSIEPGMTKAFSSVGGNTFATDLERVASQIRSCGPEGMTRAELLTANYHQLEERFLDAILHTLAGMGTLKIGRIAEGPSKGEQVYVEATQIKR